MPSSRTREPYASTAPHMDASCMLHNRARQRVRLTSVKTARWKRSLLRGTSSAPGDVASGLADVPRAAGRAAHIEDTRRANDQQEGVSQRTCRAFKVIRQF